MTGLVQYSLSRSTALFAASGDLINGGGSNFGIVYLSTAARLGESQAAVTLGVDHRF